jgi:hypothetical protein
MSTIRESGSFTSVATIDINIGNDERQQHKNSQQSTSSSSSTANAMNESRRLEGLQEQLQVMLLQEQSKAYCCKDYLNMTLPLSASLEDTNDGDLPHSSPSASPVASPLSPMTLSELRQKQAQKKKQTQPVRYPIDAECRVKMAQWCYSVIDHVKLRRETVAIAMSLLDRFLSCRGTNSVAQQAFDCRKTYQLACMGALFMAIKLNERSDIDSAVFAQLSRDNYSPIQVAEMEATILKALQWRVTAPTSLSFLKYFMALLPQELKNLVKTTQFSSSSTSHLSNITDLCAFQIDLAVGDYALVTQKPSTIAMAALINAIDAQDFSRLVDDDHHDFYHSIYQQLSLCTNMDIFSPHIQSTQKRLRHLLRSNGITHQVAKTRTRSHKLKHSSSSSRSTRDDGSGRGSRTVSRTSSTPLSSTSPSKRRSRQERGTGSPVCVSKVLTQKVSKNGIRKGVQSIFSRAISSGSSSSSSSFRTNRRMHSAFP